MNPEACRRLRELLSQPTAPFREFRVARLASRWLDDWGVPWFADPWGNLVVGAESKREYRAILRRPDDQPVRLLIAHMDHPGFHGIRWQDPGRLAVRWHGGAPTKHLRGARVWLTTDDGPVMSGRLGNARLDPDRRTIEQAVVRIDEQDNPDRYRAKHLYGGFDFRAPVRRRGRRIYTRAADDLVGVFCILETLRRLYVHRPADPPSLLGLLTRGEEVGFVGATAHFELGWWRGRPPLCISLEASRTLPGARIGHGPVIRLGDRRTPFDPHAVQMLTSLAEKRLPNRFQRRLMDGGSCEATVTTAFGLPTAGLTIPLGNYHNQCIDGGPDDARPGGPAPEFVHLDDIGGQLALCVALGRRGALTTDPWRAVRRKLAGIRRRYRTELRAPR